MIRTKNQRITLNVFDKLAEQEYRRAFGQAYLASCNIHPLPHLNEDGEKIQHGSNQAIRRIRDHWLSIADMWGLYLTEETKEKIHANWPKFNKRA